MTPSTRTAAAPANAAVGLDGPLCGTPMTSLRRVIAVDVMANPLSSGPYSRPPWCCDRTPRTRQRGMAKHFIPPAKQRMASSQMRAQSEATEQQRSLSESRIATISQMRGLVNHDKLCDVLHEEVLKSEANLIPISPVSQQARSSDSKACDQSLIKF
ncbi:hypothetical protein HPP92_012196 [Vanilla planifolia]|uniref:Uncharacterized protein n=1 Tax=Vanilla planifolia TaxID=51239 RepID=A0A835R7K8_VANPL|nr:hypothetical protein HPP92_012196 [Vanilla planifolia]